MKMFGTQRRRRVEKEYVTMCDRHPDVIVKIELKFWTQILQYSVSPAPSKEFRDPYYTAYVLRVPSRTIVGQNWDLDKYKLRLQNTLTPPVPTLVRIISQVFHVIIQQ